MPTNPMPTNPTDDGPTWKQDVGQRIRQARERANMRLDDLAFEVRRFYPGGDAPSASMLGRYERGDFGEIPTRLAWALSQIKGLDLELADLVGLVRTGRRRVGASDRATLQMGRQRKSAGQPRVSLSTLAA